MRIGDIAAGIGRVLFAGAVGTAAMTVSSTIEQRVRGRDPSTTPGDAVEKVLPIEIDEEEKESVSNIIHWAYGTAWGAPRGLLAVLGLSSPAATFAHFAAVWGGALVALPRLRVAPPVKEWGAREIAIDAWHHAVYALFTAAAFSWLDRRSRARTERPRRRGERARERIAEPVAA
jgi:hypothetical protein